MADDRHVVAPEVLYKYVSADRALDVLPEGGNGTLRATPPAALNDPLECATRCSAVYPSDDKEIDEIVRVLNSFVPDPPLTNREVEDSRRRLGTQAWNDLFRKRLSRRLGVVSFSASAHHPLLWAHYADSGTGVAIGYRVSVLETIIKGDEQLGAVKYMGDPPISLGHIIFTDESNLHAVLLTKANCWEYEQEWRLTLELKNTVGTGKRDKNGHSINLFPIPNEAVAEVYYTERTPEPRVKTIETRLRNANNRFTAGSPRKLLLAPDKYGYAG